MQAKRGAPSEIRFATRTDLAARCTILGLRYSDEFICSWWLSHSSQRLESMFPKILALSAIVMSVPTLTAWTSGDGGVISLVCDVSPNQRLLDGGYTSEQTVVAYPAEKRVFWLGVVEYKDGSPETDPSLPGRTQYVVITPLIISWGTKWPNGLINEELDIDRRTGEYSSSSTGAPLKSVPQLGQVGKCHLVGERKF